MLDLLKTHILIWALKELFDGEYDPGEKGA
jgi:hypothetical protein